VRWPDGDPTRARADGAAYNQVINGHFYWYQEEWSNTGHACCSGSRRHRHSIGDVQSHEGLWAHVELRCLGLDRIARLHPVRLAVQRRIRGSNRRAVDSQDLAHLPLCGSYSIGLTVFAIDGSSAGTGAIVTTGHGGSPTDSPSHRHTQVRHTINFSGLTTVSAQPVLTYFWDFGDARPVREQARTMPTRHQAHTRSRS